MLGLGMGSFGQENMRDEEEQEDNWADLLVEHGGCSRSGVAGQLRRPE